MPNPYEAPTAELSAQRAIPQKSHPQRDWMIWLATVSILLLCLVSAATGVALVLAWLGAQLPGFVGELRGSQLLEPLGAGGLSLTAIALAFGYGQLKAVLEYDLIWTRTLAFALFIASAALVSGAVLLLGRIGFVATLLLPAAGLFLLGLCMRQWHRKLRLARLAAPRLITGHSNSGDN